MRVGEYLSYRARLKGVERTGRTKRIDYCVEKCRIKEVRNRLLGTLSKGYRQRVGLADAMLADPPILILDEPTTGLDPVQIGETLNTIRELGGKRTVLLSTHILSEVEKVCERVIIINKGRIRFDDTLKSIAAREPTLVVEVRGPVEAVTAFLRDQPDVLSVKAAAHDGDLVTYEIKSRDRKDLREDLSVRLAGRNWPIRRLDLRRESLEDLFSAVVLRQEAAEPVAAPAA
jgi:ABC-2 type transport system ATP-binding protein